MTPNNWIERDYPKGSVISASHPNLDNKRMPATVVNHLLGGFNNSGTVGVLVRFDDGVEMRIDGEYLDLL